MSRGDSAARRVTATLATRLRTIALIAGGLVALVPAAGGAQQLPPEALNRRVRLELQPMPRTVEGHADRQVIRGIVVELPEDSVRVRLHDAATPFTIASSAIAGAELSEGIRTEIESGLLGVQRGALLGGLEWGLFNGFRKDPFFGQSFAQAVISGALVGGIIGGVLGVLRPQERWERIR
ncbi:MAG TPA: hypothetical protein VK939_11505 [Longimicrobiales bacterium]|nr:hypothetical protein [Longimicrobiales bacterium]